MIFKTTSGSHDKIIFSLFIASCVHVLVLFGLNITIPENRNSQVALDITLAHENRKACKCLAGDPTLPTYARARLTALDLAD